LIEVQKLSVKVEHIAEKKTFQSSGTDQKEEASSSEKSTPPMGAPNAAATPAAQPAETCPPPRHR
jgi:hypothetical protein